MYGKKNLENRFYNIIMNYFILKKKEIENLKYLWLKYTYVYNLRLRKHWNITWSTRNKLVTFYTIGSLYTYFRKESSTLVYSISIVVFFINHYNFQLN